MVCRRKSRAKSFCLLNLSSLRMKIPSLSKDDFLLGMQSQNRLPEDVYFNAL